METLTIRKKDSALFLSESKAQGIAARLSLKGFLASIARDFQRGKEGDMEQGFRVIAFNRNRSFAGFVAE